KLGGDPKDDREIFGKGRDPQEFPNVTLSEDGKWLLVDANQGWTKTELFFAPADSNQLKLITTGKNFLYGGEIFKGNLYVLTNEAFFNFQSYTVPPAIYRVPLAGTTQKDFKAELWQKIDSDIDPAKYEVKQEWFSSKDGTKVPMFVVHKKGIQLDGNNPTLLA